ncbi:bifunctional UDP-N-acetylglucosamine diphosphorylase/glucosamine-1-phosphate N-acetyltransferase GlmU [Hydrogenobacter hydrogenophilus]|uniref:Bifunctional protein GlmU n=1 Tax=Hydrogenobacter hydrogenophilus TaxID=35835 RepID=A0A285NWE6_9AQUI|nr:bifunctional UDP-N-acetylglucosamine diphosphorylase/glucosamine-1-phosphate N-acetyltransferase GlmU [Hydrogenobacter hydrogenophilus]SNZ12216.1 UDP-N-acetylglucosamine pyrophosphorylase /glucosamine-1-phosphate N-acetyltransferase [Hydrogenobacter hydrogenophilus]
MKAVILSAGMGTRLKSEKPKVLHTILGKPMLWYVLQTVKNSGIEDIGVVVGYGAEEVKKALEDETVSFYYQKNPRGGTADAVISSADMWRSYEGYVLVINGDAPLVRSSTLKNMQRYISMVEEYEGVKLSALVLTSFLPDPTDYGRVVKDSEGNVIKIVEEKEASFEEKKINEVNGGVYIFYAPHLLECVFSVKPSNSGELYLTEIFNLMYQKGYKTRTFMAQDPTEILGVNTRWDLAVAENVIRLRILQQWAEKGNTIHQPESVWIEPDVSLEGDVEIHPDVMLIGKTKIGKNCVIGKGSIIENSLIEEGVVIEPYSVIRNSKVLKKARIGPFAHIRDQSTVGEESQIGNFVEVKNSTIEKDVKAKHLAYIGDAYIGSSSNIGAGVVFANFDGKRKHQTRVGSNAFIGSNSLLIAPLKVGDFAFVAGGSVVNKDVPEGYLAISRPALKLLKDKGREKLT